MLSGPGKVARMKLKMKNDKNNQIRSSAVQNHRRLQTHHQLLIGSSKNNFATADMNAGLGGQSQNETNKKTALIQKESIFFPNLRTNLMNDQLEKV